MPYRDGNPTLGEQVEEDERRRFYTKEILKEAREDRAEIKRLRTALQTSLVAMKLASVLPGVSAEYDFAHAIETAEAALAD